MFINFSLSNKSSGTKSGIEGTVECHEITDIMATAAWHVSGMNMWNDGSSDLCMSCDGFLSALYGRYCQTLMLYFIKM